jgi:hypothetical protein
MALIVVHDTKMKRDRIINTDFIFHCFEDEDGVRINYSQGASGRDSVTVSGVLADFVKAVGAKRIG